MPEKPKSKALFLGKRKKLFSYLNLNALAFPAPAHKSFKDINHKRSTSSNLVIPLGVFGRLDKAKDLKSFLCSKY